MHTKGLRHGGILLPVLATVLLASGSCAKDGALTDTPDCGTAQLFLSMKMNDTGTKSVTPYLTLQNYETAMNTVEVLVFNADTKALERRVANWLTFAKGYVALSPGKKNVCVFVNCKTHETVASKGAIDWTETLSGNSVSGSSFQMYGETDVTVGKSTTTAYVTVNRLVCRVALTKIYNGLPSGYGTLTINNVWLSNVPAETAIGSLTSGSSYINRMGRKDETPSVESHILDGTNYKASCADLTFRSVKKSVSRNSWWTPATPVLVYGFPNNADAEPDGWHATFTPQKSVLVVDASIGGTRTFYPVPLDCVKANESATVEMTISDYGSDDPNEPIRRGSVVLSIGVAPWGSGATYSETI